MAGTSVSGGEREEVRGGWRGGRKSGTPRAVLGRPAPAGGGRLVAMVARRHLVVAMVIYKGPGNTDCHGELKEVSGVTPSFTLGWTRGVWGARGTGVEGYSARTQGPGVFGAKVKEKRLDWGTGDRGEVGAEGRFAKGRGTCRGSTRQSGPGQDCWLESEWRVAQP